MSQQINVEWKITEASAVARDVPTNLSALKIFERESIGPTVQLCSVGDIGFSGRVARNADFEKGVHLEEITPFLRSGDFAFCNLETSLAGSIDPGHMFVGPLSGAKLLSKAGFNVVSLANNHITDYGRAGLAETIGAISEAGIQSLGADQSVSGAKKLLTTSMNGLQIGWLGCGRTLVDQEPGGPYFWEFNERELEDAICQARSESPIDLLIVSIHIGLMYIDYPRPEHKSLAERLMAAGANVILMHHAHILQGVQVTNQGQVCCYNLGNFLFDWEEGNVRVPLMVREQNEGAVFVFTLDKSGVAKVVALPTWMDDDCRVHWATEERGVQILQRLSRISQDLEGDFVPAFRRQRAERNTHHVFKGIFFHIRHGNWSFVIECLQKVRFEHVVMTLSWLRGALKPSSK